MLDPDFLHVADRFAAGHPEVQAMAGKPFVLLEDAGRVSDIHPRRAQYRAGNRVVNLLEEPNVFTGSANLTMFRMDRIAATGLRFDERIRPNFEDGHFPVHYLLALDRPIVGLLRDARYIYRRRAAGTSTLQGSLAHPGRFSVVLEHGYLDVIREARERYGEMPEWVQHVLIYELSWYLSADEKITSDIVLPAELAPRYHELLGRIVRSLDPEVVRRHRVRPLRLVWADILAHGYRDERWHMPFIVHGRVDPDDATPAPRLPVCRPRRRRSGSWSTACGSSRPSRRRASTATTAASDGGADRLAAGGRPDRGVPRRRGGARPVALEEVAAPATPPRSAHLARPARAHSAAGPTVRRQRSGAGTSRRYVSRKTRSLQRRLASTTYFRNRYGDAWVLMDRVNDADDNGERLFEHLRANRPDMNAWFVVARESPDWERLRSAGERRLVAWGSFQWRMLMLNARWLLSSHADKGLVEPDEVMRIAGGRPWKFGFLQHGVIKDDLSLWLNNRDIDLFVVSTPAELASVAGDGTGYIVTAKETRNTGLPRFDRLLEKGRAVKPDGPRPGHRRADVAHAARRCRSTREPSAAVVDQRFWESDFNRAWLGLLRSERIRDAIARRGWRLGFMPHPNLQPVLDQLDLPEWVEPLAFAGTDVQALYARCALLVTDYSSVAFNIAYIDRPVVYFQFDRAEMLRGAHMGRQGYFDYERDGFGPVVEDLPSAERAVVAAIRHGPRPPRDYQARIDATFPVRDGGACARVVAAIEEMSRPYESVEGVQDRP